MKKSRKKKIIEENKETLVGTFKRSQNFGFVIPDDKNVEGDIYIPKRKMAKARNNQKVVVQIDKKADRKNKAEGTIIEVIGYIDEAGVDMLALIKEYKLPNEFPEPVINEALEIPQTINEKDIQRRVDLRAEEIFTIDGEDAKDLDDAVNVKKNEDGTYTLGVHIADVSYYVKSGSKLDKEAITRGTSIYMMDRVIPMLPKELSNGICSLNENQDRFTISVIMKINEKGKIIDSDIFKSVIKTTKRMNYHDVNDLFLYKDLQDGKIEKENFSDKELKRIEKVAKKYQPYIEHFLRMRELKGILKDRRDKNGSLNLDIPESKIELDENGVAVDVHKYETYFSHEIIEQFMLTANETIAEKFFWLEAPFVYRIHEIPDIDKIKETNKFLYNMNLKIKANKDSIHPKAFATVLDKVKGTEEEKIVSNLLLHTLKVARYSDENIGHFGIASKYYCHFTSPIRRYPDLFIHRIISKYLENDFNVSEDFKEKYSVLAHDVASCSSEREKEATKVEREAEKLKKAEFMESHIGEEFEGIVSSVTSFGMFVELESTVEGLVRFCDMGNEYFEYDENNKILIGENTGKTYKVGDRVNIKVKNASKELRQIDFELF